MHISAYDNYFEARLNISLHINQTYKAKFASDAKLSVGIMVAGHLTSVGDVHAKFSSLWFLLLACFIFLSFFLFAFLGRKSLQGEAVGLK